VCLDARNYGRLLLNDPDVGLHVYERCVLGWVDEGSVIFEVPGSMYNEIAQSEIQSAIRLRIGHLLPEVAFVNYDFCTCDGPPACVKVETRRTDRSLALRLAPLVFEIVSFERERMGKRSVCVPVKIVPTPMPSIVN
jgi:hypothetical protein